MDVGACCLCHCALDFSDKAAFNYEDRHEDYNEDSDEEEYFFRPNDPYLPSSLYDPHNALVYCDQCDRMYHQKCHFVPVSAVPRGEWKCLLCKDEAEYSAKAKRKPSESVELDFSNLYLSPPAAEARKLEMHWEISSVHKKAALWRSELSKRLKYQVQGQLAQIRLAETALETLTSTEKNRSHFAERSQEVAQGLARLYGSRWKLRQAMMNLEDIRLNCSDRWDQLAKFCKSPGVTKEFISRVIFPFGVLPRRIEPRTPEMRLDKESSSNPNKIGSDVDDDSGISLDELRCCICHDNTASDENDLLMCDGKGCYRAYHMKCISPQVTPEDVAEEEDDWFCPICSTLSELLLLIQVEYMGDDWEQRRLAAEVEGDEISSSDSLKSWDAVEDVFPGVKEQYDAACDLRDGRRTFAAKQLLRRVLGHDQEMAESGETDDDEDDGHFDLSEFHKNCRERGQNDSDSERSSKATLVDMSSVEYAVGASELAALSGGSDSDSNSSEDQDVRRSRRLRGKDNHVSSSTNSSVSDPGKLDEANILTKKRGRKVVDYVKLNSALFGDSPEDVASIDDHDEFRGKVVDSSNGGSTGSSSSRENEDADSDSSDGDSSDERSLTNYKPNGIRSAKSLGGTNTRPTRKRARNSSS